MGQNIDKTIFKSETVHEFAIFYRHISSEGKVIIIIDKTIK